MNKNYNSLVKDNIIQADYTFTIRQLKAAWKLCYNEDLTKEYSGFIHILEHIIKEREIALCLLQERPE